MKLRIILSALVPLLLMAGGCDFVRASLGKPTSADIQALRERLAAEEQARIDSAAQAAKLLEEQRIAERYSGIPQHRWNVLAGTFKDSLNAVSLLDELQAEGVEARLLKLRGNRTSVTLFSSDDNSEALAKMRELAADPSFRRETCIYDAQREIQTIEQQKISPQQ